MNSLKDTVNNERDNCIKSSITTNIINLIPTLCIVDIYVKLNLPQQSRNSKCYPKKNH